MSNAPMTPTPPPTPPRGLRGIRYDDAWNSSLLRPLLIAVLVVCIDVGIVEIAGQAAPSLPTAYLRMLLVAGVLAALMGGYTTNLLARADQRSRRTASFRLAEIGIILLSLRLVVWVILDSWPSLDQMLLLPLDTLFTGDYFLAAVVAFVSWIFANLFTADFTKMALQPDELLDSEAASSLSRHSDRPAMAAYLQGSKADRAEYIDRLEIVHRFAGRWIFGAVLLMIMTAAARYGVPQNGLMALTRQNINPGVMIAAVVYLLAGLILISQGQLAAMRARWALENILDVGDVLRRWPIYATLLILGMGLIAALLPFGGTFRLAQILNFILSVLQAVLGALMTLFFLFLSLFLGEEAEQPPPPTPEPPPPMVMPNLPPPLVGEPLIPPWMGGAVFWILTGLLLGYAAIIYLRGRGVTLGWLAPLWARLLKAWREMWQDLRGWQQSVAANLARRRAESGGDRATFPGRLRRMLGRLSPEEAVRYYYLDTLDQAEAQGTPRRPGETPARYAPRLQSLVDRRAIEQADPTAATTPPPALPAEDLASSAQAVQDLTNAFEAVKYGAKPMPPAEASRLKQLWEALTARLGS